MSLDKVRIHLVVSKDQYEEVAKAAERFETSISWLMRLLIAQTDWHRIGLEVEEAP